MSPRARHHVVEFNDIVLPDGVEPCRDERCPVDGIHATHKVFARGRKIRRCSKCNLPRPCACTKNAQ